METKRFAVQPIKKGAGILVPVPFDPNQVWGPKTKHYVTGTIAGCGIRGVLEPEGDRGALSLGPAWVRGASIPEGEVEVTLVPEGPQVPELADDLQAAFADAPEARVFFEGLATFYRKGFIENIEAAKRPETRSARIREMIELLKAGKDRR